MLAAAMRSPLPPTTPPPTKNIPQPKKAPLTIPATGRKLLPSITPTWYGRKRQKTGEATVTPAAASGAAAATETSARKLELTMSRKICENLKQMNQKTGVMMRHAYQSNQKSDQLREIAVNALEKGREIAATANNIMEKARKMIVLADESKQLMKNVEDDAEDLKASMETLYNKLKEASD